MNRSAKTIIIAALGILSITATSASAETWWEKTHPRRDQVNDRLENQSRRINDEYREGGISAGQAANFVKQYAESNVTIPLFSDYPPPPYIFEKQVGQQAGKIGLVRGAFFLDNPNMTPRQKEFVSKFEPPVEKEMGAKRPTVHWDIVTYDAVMLAANALKRGGSANATDFIKALAATNADGVLGHYEFDQDRGIKPEGFDFQVIRTTPDGGLEVVK